MDFVSMLLSLVLPEPKQITKPTEKVVQIQKSADTSDSEENYIKDSISDCKVYNPFGDEVIKVEWDGKCKNGFAEGKGKVTWHYLDGGYEKYTDKVTYIQGKHTGAYKSISYNLDGTIDKYITGYDLNNAIHGYGEYQTTTGMSFKGNWKKGFEHGYGKFVIANNQANQEHIDRWKNDNVGKLIGDNYIIEGIFKDCMVVTECKKEDCPKE